ncbi:hypothetical protein F4803DRAFT_552425 [Xylaria telfairii]|nr:hypothetical protein F4803DRAFT_552425 [Xylaria telfairii]
MSEIGFPQFTRLPYELRHIIWASYALPRGPMLHSVSPVDDDGGEGKNYVLICSFSLSGLDCDAHVDVCTLPTTRALMQVSYEARKAALSGRQLQRVINSDSFSVKTFNGAIRSHGHWKDRLIYHKFFFVN